MHACMHCILGESCSCMSSFFCLFLRERGARIRMCPPFPDRRQYNTTAAAKSLSRVLLYHERIVTFVLLAVQVQSKSKSKSKSSPSPVQVQSKSSPSPVQVQSKSNPSFLQYGIMIHECFSQAPTIDSFCHCHSIPPVNVLI